MVDNGIPTDHGPNPSLRERILSEYLATATGPSVVAPNRQAPLFPNRWVVGPIPLTIEQALDTGRLYPDNRRFLSGTSAGYTGSSRNSMNGALNTMG